MHPTRHLPSLDRDGVVWIRRWRAMIGVWLVGLAAIGMALTTEASLALRAAVALEPPLAHGAWLAEYLVASGVFGVGTAVLYTRVWARRPGVGLRRLRGEDLRPLGLAVLLPLATVAAGALASRLTASLGGFGGGSVDGGAVSLLAFYNVAGPAPLASVASWPGWALDTAFVVAIVAVLVGPGIAALTHGVFQTALREVLGARAAIAGTALGFAAYRVLIGLGEGPLELAGTVLLLAGFVAAAGWLYERSGNLVVPMASYGLLAAAVWLMASVNTVAMLLSAHGGRLP